MNRKSIINRMIGKDPQNPLKSDYNRTTSEMDDKLFETLKEELERTHNEHEHLQQIYRMQTGRRWVPPLRLRKIE